MHQRLLARTRAVYIWLMAPILGLAVVLAVFATFWSPVATAATTSSNLNFQARLLTNTGAVVPDGNYNIDFKIYTADSTTGSVGTCSGSCVWEETRKNSNSQGVQVINGYFSVNLGSVTAFGGSINWDQQLWLTMNIGGTTTGASPTWDGEMQNAGHSIALTALPYSFTAGQLALTSGAHRGTLAFNTVATDPAILLPDASGTVCLQAASACGFETTSGTDFIRNQTSTQTANFNIQSAASGSIGAVVTGASGQSVDIFDVKANAVGTPLFGVGSGGLISMQPAAGLTSGQTALAQTLTNASNSGGTVTGLSQTITISNTTSASTTIGQSISITDSSAGLSNRITGLQITTTTAVSGSGIGVDISLAKGIGVRSVATASGQVTNVCANITTSAGIAVCADDPATSNAGLGTYSRSASRSTTGISDYIGSGVYGINTGSGTAGGFYGGVKGITIATTNAAYTTVGIYGEAKGGNTATAYGGYFTLNTGSGTLAAASAALYATNTTVASNIFQLQDGSGTPSNVVTVADEGATTFQNHSNSAAAFQIQDVTGSDLMNINTTDGYVINNGANELGNLIQNPSFESSGTTDGTGWYTPSATQVITNSSANAHAGNYELQVTGNSSTHAVTTKYFAVHPGDQIYVEAYVKNSAGATGDGGIYVEFSDKDKSNTTFSNADTGLPGTSYVLKTLTLTVPANKTFVRIAASVKATATAGTFYFDDFYLKRINEQAPLLLTNVSTTAFQVQNSSSQTVLGVDTTNSKIFTGIPDSGTAIGFTFNTPSYTTSGAKLISIQNSNAEKFSIDKDGNAAVANNVTAGGNVSAGTGKQFQINGTQVTSAILSNDNNLAKLSGTGPQIFSGDNKFTGTALVANANTAGFQVQNASTNVLTVDTSGNKVILGTGGAPGLTGKEQFNFNGSTGSITITALDPSSTAYTLSLPAETGTFCTSAATSTGNCTNFASAAGVTTSLAGKLNKGAVDTSSAAVTAVQGDLYTFTNSNSGIGSGVLKLDNGNNSDSALYVTASTDYGSGKAYIVVNNTNGTPTGNLIDLQANASSVFSVDAVGNITNTGNINIGSGKQFQIGGVQVTSAILSNNSDLAKLTTGTQTFTNTNTFSNAANSFTGNGSGLTSLNGSNISSGTVGDNFLTSNVALLNRTGQTFTGDNTFAPTAGNVGTLFKQTSGTATSGSVLDVQTADGLSHFLQITNAAANEGNVTLQSVGATRQLTLNSSNGTIALGSATTVLQKQGNALTIDVAAVGNSTLTITSSFASGGAAASLSVQGDITAGTSHVYKVGTTAGTTVSACGGSQFLASQAVVGGIVSGGACANAITSISAPTTSYANGATISTNALILGFATASNPGIVSTTSQIFGGDKAIQSTSATAFQVQTNSGGSTLMTANTNNMSVTVTGAQIYGSNTYTSGTSSTITQATVDSFTTILASATATNLTFTVPSPTTASAGRLLYVTNNGSNSFVISYGTGSFSLSVNSTVTLVWNGAAWTSAGADAGTLQTGYNNSTNSSTTPEIKVDSSRGGLDIQDADSTIGGNLLSVRASAAGALGTSLFSVASTGNVSVQNTGGVQLFNLDTTADAANLITNGSSELTPVSGTAKAGTGATPTLSQVGTGTVTPYVGNFSMSVATSSGDATNSGVKWSGTFTNSQAYNFTVYARASGSNFATFQLGNSNNNSTDTSCLTAQTVVTGGWTRFTCSFTYTGTTGTSYVYVKQTDSTNRTYYLDALKLETTSISTPYKESTISIEGVFNQPGTFRGQSDSTTAFQVQSSSGGNVLVVDSLNKQLKVYDGAGGSGYALIYYDSTSGGTANYTASTGTVAVGAGAGAITVTAGTGSAVNITANATSSWKTNTGTLTLQSGSGSSDFLILNSGGSNQIQVSGTSILKFGSTTADPTCVNGAIYYNTTTPQFRGCVNGTWQNLASITPTLQTTYNSSTGGVNTPEVKLNAGGTDTGGFDIQDADTSIAGVLFAVRKTNNATLGTSMFNVDTSNNSVNVGSNSGHSTNPIILVLDNYANSGADPTTTINGSLYYNGTKNKFRCYENGAWVNCLNGPAENATSFGGTWAATAAKAAANIIYVTPLYLSGQMTVNEIRVDVTTTLGAAGDVGIYDSSGNLVINGGSSSLTTATGFKTITPTQANKILEAGQYYAAVTWNSTTGAVAGNTILSGQIKHVGTLATGGLVLPSTITVSSITIGTVVPGITINN